MQCALQRPLAPLDGALAKAVKAAEKAVGAELGADSEPIIFQSSNKEKLKAIAETNRVTASSTKTAKAGFAPTSGGFTGMTSATTQ